MQLCTAYRQKHAGASALDFMTHLAMGRLFYDFSYAADATFCMVTLSGAEPGAELIVAAGGRAARDAICLPMLPQAIARRLCLGNLFCHCFV